MKITQQDVEDLGEQIDRWERGLDGANETDVWQYRVARALLFDWLPERLAKAWDEGRAAERRDWEFTFDLTTPDEERQPYVNPYRTEEEVA